MGLKGLREVKPCLIKHKYQGVKEKITNDEMARLLRKFSSSIQPVFQTLARTFIFLKVQCTNKAKFRDPYSFFLRVVSWASKPDSIHVLAHFQFGLPRQKCRII